MKRKVSLLASILLLLITPNHGWGQGVEYLGVKDGLSQGLIVRSLQDAEGFLWFGTLSGLNRYDGRNFKTFYHDPLNKKSLRSDRIFAMADAGDFILVSTEAGGIDAYHKKTGFFTPVEYRKDSLGLATKRVRKLTAGRNGEWFGLFKNRRSENLFIQFRLVEDDSDGLILSEATRLLPGLHLDDLGTSPDTSFIYVGSKDTLYRANLDQRDFKFKRFPTPKSLSQGNFEIASDGKLWFNNQATIACFEAGKWKVWEADFVPKGICFIDKNNLVIPSTPNDIWTFSLPLSPDGKLRKAQATHHETVKFTNFQPFLLDASDVLWFGSSGRGLLKVDPRKKRFTSLFKGKSVRRPINIDGVGNVSIVVNGDELLSIEKGESPASIRSSGLPYRRLLIDENRTEWLAEKGGNSLLLLQKKNEGQWTQLFEHFVSEDEPFIGDISDIQIDPKGNLWIATSGKLFRYIPGNTSPELYSYPNAFARAHKTMDLKILADGTLWVATSIGLLKTDVLADSIVFEYYTSDAVDGKGLRNNKLSSLLPDPVNPEILWISSLGGGISQMNTTIESFIHWSRQSGQLTNDYVYGLLADDAGNIWWSSNQGLSRYSPTTNAFNHFNVNDGLPANEFNMAAYAKGPDGKLFFGCIEGLVVFDPEEIVPNTHTPSTRIVSLEVNDTPWSMLKGKKEEINSPAFLTSIDLLHDQNNLDIEFVGLEYSAPAKQQFRFYLEGAESEWNKPTFQNQVSYLNLQPGHYTFKVVAANGDGIWHEELTEIKIRIFPPWWQTTVAYLIYTLLGLLIIAGLTRYLLRRQSYRFRLQLEQQETTRLQELQRFRASLYQSVTHEFRSPLSVINSVAREWLKTATDKKKASTVLRSSQRMLDQVDRMLTVATVEKDELPYHARTGDVAAFLVQLVEERSSSFQAAKLDLQASNDPTTFITAFDPYYLETILGNLLDNALKYSGPGSTVNMNFQVNQDANELVFEVMDNGAGISSDLLPKIFDRHVRTTNAAQQGRGFGIGLAYVKELIDRLGGDIEVESTLGHGSQFTVRLPLDLVEASPMPDTILEVSDQTSNQTKSERQEQHRILVVEDNTELREFLYSSLSEGFEVLTAANGALGCELAEEHVPDLIISDLVMPKKDGLQLVNQLKNDERTSHIPIILLTSKTGLENRLRGLARGANVYLGKPFDLRELRLNIRNLLDQQQRLQDKYLLQSSFSAAELPQSDDPEQQFLEKVRSTLLEHLDEEEFKVPDLAKKLGVSRSQLFKKLKALTGVSTSLYVRRLRLAEARRLLEDEQQNISEIAYATGFKYVQHFSRYYAEIYGESPTETRNKKSRLE